MEEQDRKAENGREMERKEREHRRIGRGGERVQVEETVGTENEMGS